MNASSVGGNSSSVRDFLVKSCLRAVLRSVQSLVLSYMIMTNRSKASIVASPMSSVTSHRFKNASVTTGYEDQASQAVFLPLLAKLDTVSHPVKQWKTGSALHLSGPREFDKL